VPDNLPFTIFTYLHTFHTLSHLYEVWCKLSAHNTLYHFQVSLKSVQGSRTFRQTIHEITFTPDHSWNYIYACTVKLCDIWAVKNAYSLYAVHIYCRLFAVLLSNDLCHKGQRHIFCWWFAVCCYHNHLMVLHSYVY